MEIHHPEQVTRRDVRGVPLDERVDLAYRLASMAREEVETLPHYAQATVEAIDAAVVHALRMAINVAEGREPWEARAPGKAPGGVEINWKALTGRAVDDLVYLVRIEMVRMARMEREHKQRSGSKPPHSGSRLATCKKVLGDLLGEDKETARVREYAEKLVSIVKRRDSEIGWKLPDTNVQEPLIQIASVDVYGWTEKTGGPDLFQLMPETIGRRPIHKMTPLPRLTQTKTGD